MEITTTYIYKKKGIIIVVDQLRPLMESVEKKEKLKMMPVKF